MIAGGQSCSARTVREVWCNDQPITTIGCDARAPMSPPQDEREEREHDDDPVEDALLYFAMMMVVVVVIVVAMTITIQPFQNATRALVRHSPHRPSPPRPLVTATICCCCCFCPSIPVSLGKKCTAPLEPLVLLCQQMWCGVRYIHLLICLFCFVSPGFPPSLVLWKRRGEHRRWCPRVFLVLLPFSLKLSLMVWQEEEEGEDDDDHDHDHHHDFSLSSLDALLCLKCNAVAASMS